MRQGVGWVRTGCGGHFVHKNKMPQRQCLRGKLSVCWRTVGGQERTRQLSRRSGGRTAAVPHSRWPRPQATRVCLGLWGTLCNATRVFPAEVHRTVTEQVQFAYMLATLLSFHTSLCILFRLSCPLASSFYSGF